MRREQADAMVVVVPVRDEALLLEASLAALTTAVDAATQVGIRSEVRIVLDACTDTSAEVAGRFSFPTLVSTAGRVGAARALGVCHALDTLADTRLARIWVANTDADSRVPVGWLTHFQAISRIADVCLGTVRPDFADLSAAQQTLWLRTHTPGRPNGNTHGANLGIRASTYLSVGGFAPIGEHEDVDLVARCRSQGATIAASDDAEVITSGRLIGRTPGGYAGYLRGQVADLAADAAE